MAEEPKDQLREHHFDGIQEYDNNLPRWWLMLFYLTIAWSALYVGFYHLGGPGVLGGKRWDGEMKELAEVRAKHATGPLSEEQLRGLSKSAERIAKGKALFVTNNCATCHGAEGTGVIGPNLRDRHWMYGSNLSDIVDVIANGRANGTMPASKNSLSGDDIANLAIYVVDLNRQGEKPGKPIDPAREKDAPITY